MFGPGFGLGLAGTAPYGARRLCDKTLGCVVYVLELVYT